MWRVQHDMFFSVCFIPGMTTTWFLQPQRQLAHGSVKSLPQVHLLTHPHEYCNCLLKHAEAYFQFSIMLWKAWQWILQWMFPKFHQVTQLMDWSPPPRSRFSGLGGGSSGAARDEQFARSQPPGWNLWRSCTSGGPQAIEMHGFCSYLSN